MPCYTFLCPKCNKQEEVVRPMADAEKPWQCTSCLVPMRRNFKADLPFASGGDYSRPIHSDSLAVSPSQRTEHEKAFPNIKLDSECRPVFSNFQDHDNYLKKTGFRKKRQRIKPKGKRIA